MPPVNPTARGSKATALTAAGDPELLAKAMEEFEADVYSVNDTSHFYDKRGESFMRQ